MSAVYALPASHLGLVSHYTQKLILFHDIDKYEELRIHVKSGDYFMQLATILDAIQDVHMSNHDIAKVLNRIIGDLVYLQAHYDIHEKS
jgi:hypothetical protein